MTRLKRGALLGPLIFGAITFLLNTLALSFDPKGLASDWYILPFIFMLTAVAIAYLNVFFFGLPFYRALQKNGRDTLLNIMLGGFFMGMVSFHLFALLIQARHINYDEGVPMFAISGTAVAFLVWFIGVREPKPRA